MANMRAVNRLYNLVTQHIVSKCIVIAAERRLDDLLYSGPVMSEQLATMLGFHPDAFSRFLRVLTAFDVVSVNENGEVKAGELAQYLDLVRGPHLIFGHNMLMHLESALASNSECYSKAFGKNFFTHITENESMRDDLKTWAEFTAAEWLVPAIEHLHNFSKHNCLAVVNDDGYVLSELLLKFPKLTGVYFGKQAQLDVVTSVLVKCDVASRVNLIAIESVNKESLAQVDLIIFCRALLKEREENAISLLNLFQQFGEHVRKLIIDFYLPEPNSKQYKTCVAADINILCCLDGYFRTKSEWLSLLKKAKINIMGDFKILSTEDEIVVQPTLPVFALEYT